MFVNIISKCKLQESFSNWFLIEMLTICAICIYIVEVNQEDRWNSMNFAQV